MAESLPGVEAVPKVNVWEALGRHFARPEWFLFHEVTLGDRRMDALAVGCFQSHGWRLVGIEVKENRADWLRELKDPAKGDALFQRTDEWYIAAPEGIVQPDEVPEGWGWIRVNARGCRRMKRPPARRAAPVDRELLLRLLFLSEDRERRTLAAAESKWHAEEEPRIKDAVEREVRYRGDQRNDALRHYQDLQQSVRDFEAASGIRINNYNGKHIGPQVEALRRLLAATGDHWALDQVETAARSAIEAVGALRQAREAVMPKEAP